MLAKYELTKLNVSELQIVYLKEYCKLCLSFYV